MGDVSHGTETPNLDDKMTLNNTEQRESAMVRYYDLPPTIITSNISDGELRITGMTGVPSNCNLAANVTSTSSNATMLGAKRK